MVSLCLLFSCANETTQKIGVYSGYEFPDTAEVVSTSVNNLYDGKTYKRTIESFYLKGYDAVPFMSAGSTFVGLMQLVTDGTFESSMSADGSALTITRTDVKNSNGDNLSMTIDASAQTISSDDFIQMTTMNEFKNGIWLAVKETDKFCSYLSGSVSGRTPVTFNVNKSYGLKIYSYKDDKGNADILIPSQLAGLVLFSSNIVSFSYNGMNYYIYPDLSSGVVADSYLAGYGRGGSRTRAETEFNYRMLCMLFDKYYCLQHLRTDDMNYGFNTFVYTHGLDQALLSSNAAVYDEALVEALETYVDDGHTAYKYPSYYEDASAVGYYNTTLRHKYSGTRNSKLDEIHAELTGLRKNAFPSEPSDYCGGLRFIKDTSGTEKAAVITFDNFFKSSDTYEDAATAAAILAADPEVLAGKDSFELFYNALYQITHTHTGVKNIIIDESCNFGGDADACLYLANIFIPCAKLYINNTLDGAKSDTSYNVDIDLDGDASSNTGMDLSSYHIYVLTSESSFSCGNLFPSILKDQRSSDMSAGNAASIALIGKKTGGGAGVVLAAGTGDGALFNMSSCFELFTKGGTSVDGGVEPDLELGHDVFYDDGKMLTALETNYSENFK
jgi:hypothetical protein